MGVNRKEKIIINKPYLFIRLRHTFYLFDTFFFVGFFLVICFFFYIAFNSNIIARGKLKGSVVNKLNAGKQFRKSEVLDEDLFMGKPETNRRKLRDLGNN